MTKSYRYSKKLYVWETGPVDDLALLLLCGDCNFKVSLIQFIEVALLLYTLG